VKNGLITDIKFNLILKGHMKLQTYNFMKNTALMSLMFNGNQFLILLNGILSNFL
jgi:hypothetical protein